MVAYKIAAKAGDAFSQYQLGGMLIEALGVERDFTQAAAWFEQAAAQEMPLAVMQLGRLHQRGHAPASSWRRARELLQRSVDLGFFGAQAVNDLQIFARTIAKVMGQAEHVTSSSVTCGNRMPLARSLVSSSRSPPTPQSLMDQRIEIHGTSRHDLNGKRGVATDFHPVGSDHDHANWRYTVQLDSGYVCKVKQENVRAEPADSAAGARPKAKGKGKKGAGRGK